MSKKNILGESIVLKGMIEYHTESLNSSMEQVIKTDLDLKAIKSVTFSTEDIEGEIKLIASVNLRSGVVVKEIFLQGIDEDDISLDQTDLEAYFVQEIVSLLNKQLSDGPISSDYLKAYEPEIFVQLSKLQLLTKAPDVNLGNEFSLKDKEFFLNIIRENS